MVASRALVVVQTAMYLTGYSDRLTGFHEPLSPPYKCHTRRGQGEMLNFEQHFLNTVHFDAYPSSC